MVPMTLIVIFVIQMKLVRSLLIKILIIIISCCFSISATETDVGCCQQTFFDDYDTYLPPAQQNLQANDGEIFLQKIELNPDNFFSHLNYNFLFHNSYNCSYSNPYKFQIRKLKIFLHNSSLLI